ncbi:MAG: TorF family putative porin [Sphingobium sp.]
MKKYFIAAAALMLPAAPAFAQDEPAEPITISGSVAIVSDYRFRGVSQSDEELAVQGGFSVSHESGFYVGTWASNLAGWGTFGGSNTELDIYGGFKAPVGPVTIDVGVTWYMYPGGSDITDFAEPYVKLSGTAGPASLTLGVAYAPKQEALGNWSATPESEEGDKEDNFYIWGDVAGGIPDTPITLKAHLGYSNGNPGLGPNGTSVAPTGKYVDYMVGADVAVGPVVLGIAYVGTDISYEDRAYLADIGSFINTKDGSSISSGKIVGSISAAF